MTDALLADLAAAGEPVADLWDLVNSPARRPAAVPVLLDWLHHLDERVTGPQRERVREGIVRALSVPDARPAAAPELIAQFRAVADPTGFGVRWAIGNALAVVADDSVFDELAELARDPAHGPARQMLLAAIGRSRDPRAPEVALSLLGDEDVVAHALAALAKLKPEGARPAVEPLLAHPKPLVRKEAKKALAKLP